MIRVLLRPHLGVLLMLAVATFTVASPVCAQRGAPSITRPALVDFRVDSAATSLRGALITLEPAEFLALLRTGRPAGFYALTLRRSGMRECTPVVSYDADEHFLTVMIRVLKAQPGPDAGRPSAALPVLAVQCSGSAADATPPAPDITVGAAGLYEARDSNGDIMVQAEVEPADVAAVRRSLAVVLVFEVGEHRPGRAVFPATRASSGRSGGVRSTAQNLDVVWARNLSAWLVDGRTGRVLTKRTLAGHWTSRAP